MVSGEHIKKLNLFFMYTTDKCVCACVCVCVMLTYWWVAMCSGGKLTIHGHSK